MTDEQMSIASRMWMDGHLAKKIAKVIGVTDKHLYDVASRRRNLFPHRQRAVGDGRRFIVAAMPANIDRPVQENCMRWVTEQGATVTLPKISFIECPRAAA